MTYRTSEWLRFVRQSLNKKKKLKWWHTVAFVFAYLAWSNADSRLSHANEVVRCYKKSPQGNGHKSKEGVLRARGLSVTLLKSTFKLQDQMENSELELVNLRIKINLGSHAACAQMFKNTEML